ncbi:MAG: hypothetical protein V7629_02025 [Motiliproteus sp.]
MLIIEVASDKWFAGGTRIGHVEINDAIVLQREQFALNTTLQEQDRTWTVQQWSLVVYPQRSGSFEVPPISLSLSIAGDNLETLTGKTQTEPISFSAAWPQALADQRDWVATTRLEVSESYNKPIVEFKLGDALRRTVTISADNLPAMMLPKLAAPDIEGVARYLKPAQLSDKVNRGEYLAERSQQITYVFEVAGEFEIPAETFYWWNLATQQVEVITLPALSLVVTGPPGQVNDLPGATSPDSGDFLKQMLPTIYQGIAVVFLLIMALWLTRRGGSSDALKATSKETTPTGSWLLKQARKACRQNDPEQALGYLYRWMSQYDSAPDSPIRHQVCRLNNDKLTADYDKIMQAIYSGNRSESPDTWKFIKRLTAEIKKQNRPKCAIHSRVDLTLNYLYLSGEGQIKSIALVKEQGLLDRLSTRLNGKDRSR